MRQSEVISQHPSITMYLVEFSKDFYPWVRELEGMFLLFFFPPLQVQGLLVLFQVGKYRQDHSALVS